MSNIWHDMNPERIRPDDFIAVIEISKGSKKKYELDKETGYLILDRILYTSTHYPANYGLIPRTYADDGDPLDVLVLCSEELEPLTLVRCYPIGMMKMIDNGGTTKRSSPSPSTIPPTTSITTSANCPPMCLRKCGTSFRSTRRSNTSRPLSTR